MRGQLKEASSATSKAFCAFRKELDPELECLNQGSEGSAAGEALEDTQMSQAIAIMKPILRYMQLLCENHNTNLQVRSRPGDLTGGAGENLLFVLVRIRFVDWSHSAPSGALHNRVLSGLQNHKA